MSGVDYASALVTKEDLQKVEKRIQTNTLLTQIPLASAANVLYYDATTKNVSYNTAPGGSSSESGFSYVNTTNAAILNIPTTATIIPISNAASPTISYSFNWKSADWDIPTPTNNRLVYTGTSKRFLMHVDILLGLTGALPNPSAQIYIALYKNGTVLANSMCTQAINGSLGGQNMPIVPYEFLSAVFPITATNPDYFTLHIYGSSTGINIDGTQSATFVTSVLCPSITIECRQVNI